MCRGGGVMGDVLADVRIRVLYVAPRRPRRPRGTRPSSQQEAVPSARACLEGARSHFCWRPSAKKVPRDATKSGAKVRTEPLEGSALIPATVPSYLTCSASPRCKRPSAPLRGHAVGALRLASERGQRAFSARLEAALGHRARSVAAGAEGERSMTLRGAARRRILSVKLSAALYVQFYVKATPDQNYEHASVRGTYTCLPSALAGAAPRRAAATPCPSRKRSPRGGGGRRGARRRRRASPCVPAKAARRAAASVPMRPRASPRPRIPARAHGGRASPRGPTAAHRRSCTNPKPRVALPNARAPRLCCAAPSAVLLRHREREGRSDRLLRHGRHVVLLMPLTVDQRVDSVLAPLGRDKWPAR